MLQLSGSFFERNHSVCRDPRKDLIPPAWPPHFNRRHAGCVSQSKVQSHVVVGAITRAATHLVDPYPRSFRGGTRHGDARPDPVAIRSDAGQMDPKPMVVVPGQVNQQKWKVAHIVNHRLQSPIIPKIADGETSARLRPGNARSRLPRNILELPVTLVP